MQLTIRLLSSILPLRLHLAINRLSYDLGFESHSLKIFCQVMENLPHISCITQRQCWWAECSSMKASPGFDSRCLAKVFFCFSFCDNLLWCRVSLFLSLSFFSHPAWSAQILLSFFSSFCVQAVRIKSLSSSFFISALSVSFFSGHQYQIVDLHFQGMKKSFITQWPRTNIRSQQPVILLEQKFQQT